jgi:hypothetical protein
VAFYRYNVFMVKAQQSETFSAWNPGIEPEIPAAYRKLETIYHPANVFTALEEISQLGHDTGISALELICFRPHRLALHALVVRITADIVVLEGEVEEDLGINFRKITKRIFDHYVQPRLAEMEQSYELLRARIEDLTLYELGVAFDRLNPTKAPLPTLWQRLTLSRPVPSPPQRSREEREFELINALKTRRYATDDELEAAVLRSLHRVLDSIARTRGFIGNDLQYLAHICVLHASNYLGSRYIGEQIDELVSEAIKVEGYCVVSDAQKPILISLKGASASGKSSLRPKLRSMMAELGIKDQGYATISPDIWRRLLLDYESLGDCYKYAGRFTSHEVSVIDARLDHYIRAKAEKRHSIPHLVVDRFRFDSFTSEKIGRVLHNTYVRYVDTMYMYFIVTPPEATVERGWQRGLERGRYKSVEDFLGHSVEAYTGMPKLLFKWLSNATPRYFFEFLDNSVPRGTYPKLIARGTQGSMQIFEPASLIDIERFRRINIRANAPEQVAAAPTDCTIENNLGLLRQCIKRIERIDFIDADSDSRYLSVRSGTFEIDDKQLFLRKMTDKTLHVIISELAPGLPTS